jgi:hypothetical protein
MTKVGLSQAIRVFSDSWVKRRIDIRMVSRILSTRNYFRKVPLKSRYRQVHSVTVRSFRNPVFKELRDSNCPKSRLIVHVMEIGADHVVVDVAVQLDSEGAVVHADIFQHASFEEEMDVRVIILVRQAVEISNERDSPQVIDC